uniref:PE-PGRS family protein n=1 Tax=Parastrongyloides trichosuri TaxID=131310 RepID=A0A0N4Z2Y2_PARTI
MRQPGRGADRPGRGAGRFAAAGSEAVGRGRHDGLDPDPRRSSGGPGRRGLGQRGGADHPPRPVAGGGGLHPQVGGPADYGRGHPGHPRRRHLGARGRGGGRGRGRSSGPHRQPDAVAAAHSGGAEGRAAEQADRLRSGRDRGHHQGAPDQRLPQAGGAEPDPGGDLGPVAGALTSFNR